MLLVCWWKDRERRWAIFNDYSAAEFFWRSIETGWMHSIEQHEAYRIVSTGNAADSFWIKGPTT